MLLVAECAASEKWRYSFAFRDMTGVIVFGMSSKHHHDDTHEGADEDRQKRQDRVCVYFSRYYEKSNQTSNGEENEKCFS